MNEHLSPYPRRRPFLERIGLRRDLSEVLILRDTDRGDGDLVDTTAGWVAAEEIDRPWPEWVDARR